MITSLDLFSGAGGFTLGLKNAGIKTIGAIELDRFASQTFRANFPDIPHYQADINEYGDSDIKRHFMGVDIITGGPPCQGFSVAGPSQYGKIDLRNNLILEMYRFASILQPSLVILENVKGILNGKLSPTKKALDEYINKMNIIGYKTKIFVLKTSEFGIPQGRERVFIFAAKNPALIPLEIPGEFVEGKKAKRTVGEALEDLPIIGSGEGIEGPVPYPVDAITEYQKWLRKGSPGVYNHVAMKHTKRLIERFRHIGVGQSLKDVSAKHGQRARNGQELDTRQRFKMNNQRLDPNGISTAITASFQSNFIHPLLHRNLTAREGARLQSFPDHFIFCGPRTLMSKTLLEREGRHEEIGLSQYNQIGNAVPPLLAESIGKTILNQMDISLLKSQG
jgi:DNA (cytosine-5)-methyltransferase 1